MWQTLRLSRLIDDLLELSRLQSRAVAATKQKFDLKELLYDLADRYRDAADEKGLSIQLNIGEEELYAYSNPDRIEQVFIVLLDNAVKHATSEGEIELSSHAEGDKYRVCVKNPGSINIEDAEHLFERFYKVDKSHSGSGTGLGLAIAKEVLALLGEKISVKAENDEIAFSFTLDRYVK
jgi:signal transduction histidine kinase